MAKKTRSTEMTNPLQKLMCDCLYTGAHNKDLREILLYHYKEEEKTPYTFEEQLARAKSSEAHHNTNIAIVQSTNLLSEKQIHQANLTTLHNHSAAGLEASGIPATNAP